jgi:hypothetical protein
MLIDSAIRLLGPVPSQELAARVLELAEAEWHCDKRRQDTYDVHSQTQSLILMFCDSWPTVRVTRANGWRLLARDAVPVMEKIIRDHYVSGGVVLRAMMARLPPGCSIPAHCDVHPSFSVAHRIHVPLTINPGVEFVVGEERVALQEHVAFELNNHLPHRVANRGATSRIHFIFDYAEQGT